MFKITRFLSIIIVSTLLLAGCATQQRASTPNLNLSANDYLQMASSTKGPEKQRLLLMATNRLLQNRNPNAAQQVIYKMNNAGLTPELRTEQTLAQAKIWLLSDEADRTINSLQAISTTANTLSVANQIELHQMLSNAYAATGNLLALINERDALTDLYQTPQQKQTNLVSTWETLQTLSPQKITQLQTSATNTEQQGWLALALLANEPQPNAQTILNKINIWKSQFANHPANTLLNNIQSHIAAAQPNQPKPKAEQIALLLPLTGRLAQQGNAIRNGFFAAYYNNTSKTKPNVEVYDTNNTNITGLYEAAIKQGATFVVGPLLKNNVATLTENEEFTVPTLALNTLSNVSDKVTNLYQYGLSPTSEAAQAANKIWQDQHNHIMIIAPANNWGQRVADAFKQQWTTLGGQVTAQLNYRGRANLAKNIRSTLNINNAYERHRSLERILNEKVRFTPWRRQDIDSIFIVANNTLGRQIVPMLKFYYAGDIPVYSTSLVYAGTPNARRDNDLNGVVFDDMPWTVDNKRELPHNLENIRAHIKLLWPASFKHNARLYGLGVDAYRLSSQLETLNLIPNFGIIGATGMLYLQPNQHITRKLTWSQMKKGRPSILPQN